MAFNSDLKNAWGFPLSAAPAATALHVGSQDVATDNALSVSQRIVVFLGCLFWNTFKGILLCPSILRLLHLFGHILVSTGRPIDLTT